MLHTCTIITKLSYGYVFTTNFVTVRCVFIYKNLKKPMVKATKHNTNAKSISVLKIMLSKTFNLNSVFIIWTKIINIIVLTVKGQRYFVRLTMSFSCFFSFLVV